MTPAAADDDNEGLIQAIHVLSVLLTSAIVYFVWKSTQVRGIGPVTNSIHNISYVRRSTAIITASPSVSAAEDNLNDSVEQILAEATDSYRPHDDDDTTRSTSTEDGELTEEEMIVYDMDAGAHDVPTTSGAGIRRRRTDASTSTSSEVSAAEPATTVATTSSDEIQSHREEDRISIKLKYLNDEIKSVSGYTSETIGNFKRRQFNSELESKSIKLIFNGQILDDDTKSLTQCGIFADAVVHCLMLQKRNVATSTETAGNIVTRQRAAAGNTHLISSLLNADWNAPLCIYILLIIVVTLTLSFCWYCRIQYSNYFSWYSTIGLIVMTSIFIVSVPLLSLIEP